MEAILSSDEVKGDPVGPAPVTTSLQQIIMAISYLAKVNPNYVDICHTNYVVLMVVSRCPQKNFSLPGY